MRCAKGFERPRDGKLAEGSRNVFDRGAPPGKVHGSDVDSHALHIAERKRPRTPEQRRCSAQARALCTRDALKRRDPRARAARSHLDDREQAALTSDDVELERSEPHVSRQELVAADEKQISDGVLGRAPNLSPRQGFVSPCAVPQLDVVAAHTAGELALHELGSYWAPFFTQ